MGRGAPRRRDEDGEALAFQLRAIPKSALVQKIRPLSGEQLAQVERATDEVLGGVEPE